MTTVDFWVIYVKWLMNIVGIELMGCCYNSLEISCFQKLLIMPNVLDSKNFDDFGRGYYRGVRNRTCTSTTCVFLMTTLKWLVLNPQSIGYLIGIWYGKDMSFLSQLFVTKQHPVIIYLFQNFQEFLWYPTLSNLKTPQTSEFHHAAEATSTEKAPIILQITCI